MSKFPWRYLVAMVCVKLFISILKSHALFVYIHHTPIAKSCQVGYTDYGECVKHVHPPLKSLKRVYLVLYFVNN